MFVHIQWAMRVRKSYKNFSSNPSTQSNNSSTSISKFSPLLSKVLVGVEGTKFAMLLLLFSDSVGALVLVFSFLDNGDGTRAITFGGGECNFNNSCGLLLHLTCFLFSSLGPGCGCITPFRR